MPIQSLNFFFLSFTILSRRIKKDKSEETDARPTHTNKGSVRNPAIWKIVSGGVVASSDSAVTTTTAIVTGNDDKTKTETRATNTTVDVVTATFATEMEAASAAAGGVDHVVVEDLRGAVGQLSK